MANVLGSLLISLSAETSAFSRGMSSAKAISVETSGEIVESLKRIGEQMDRLKFGSLGEWQKSGDIMVGVMAGVATAVAATTIAVAKDFASQAKEMSKLSQSYGLSVEQISQMRVASKLTGVDMETLTMGLGRMARAAAAAAEGGKQQSQAFHTLGVNVTDGAGHLRPMNDLLLDVADRFSKLHDGTGKTALAMQLFGRSGAALIPFLDRGRAGIEEFIRVADEFGIKLSNEDLIAGVRFQEMLEMLELKADGLKQSFASGLIPALNEIGNAFLHLDGSGVSLARTLGSDVGNAFKEIATYIKSSEIEAQKLWAVLTNPIGQFAQTKQQIKDLNQEYLNFVNDMHGAPVVNKAPSVGGDDGGKGNPTFSAAAVKNPDSGLTELLNRARELFNKAADDSLKSQISNIENLKNQLKEFAQTHPEKIFLDINAAVEKLNKTEQELIAKSQGELSGQLTAGIRNQGNAAMALPVTPPSATGGVQQQRELYDLGNDINQQNRERLQIYQQTRTPLEQYQEQVAKLNTLYKDHSSTEYTRALADAKEKMLGIFDPMQKLVKQQQELNQEYASGLLSEEAYTNETKKLELAMDELKLKTGGVRDGLRIFFQQSQQQAQSWATQVHTALTSAFNGIESSMSRAFTQMIMGTKTVGQAFREMGQGILQAIVEACAQMIAKWIVTHVVMAAISKIFGKVAAVSEAITGATTNSALATSAAFLGAANAYAFWAWNPPVAATMAGAALSAGLGFAASALTAGVAGSVASAAGGMEVTHDQLAFIHKDEKVLPASISRGFNSIINSFNTPSTGSGHTAFAGGAAGGAASSLRSMGGTTIHIHGATNPTSTAKQVGRVIDAKFAAMARRSGVK